MVYLTANFRRFIVFSLLFSVLLLPMFAQSYSVEYSVMKSVPTSDFEDVAIVKQSLTQVALTAPVMFGNQKYSSVFVSTQGWLSYQSDANVKQMQNEIGSGSMIAPFVSYQGHDIYSGYAVSHKTMELYGQNCEVFVWKDSDLMTQVFLFENGDIRFAAIPATKTLKETLEMKGNFFSGVIEPGLASGYFPFELPFLKKEEMIAEHLFNGKMFFYKNRYNNQ